MLSTRVMETWSYIKGRLLFYELTPKRTIADPRKQVVYLAILKTFPKKLSHAIPLHLGNDAGKPNPLARSLVP